jgi:PRD domain protein (TIGR03582 family)
VTRFTVSQRKTSIPGLYVEQITIASPISTSKWKTTRYKPSTPPRSLKNRLVNEVPRVNNGAVMVNEAEELTTRIQDFIYALFKSKHITPNAVQEQMLASHVKAMAHRSLTGEPLPEVEESLFEEISAESMEMAQAVVDQFGNLPVEEAWLLSVHFEVAKDNL